MESDPSWKQVIPYPVLRDGDAWFLMRRTKAGGDARLHDRYVDRRRRPRQPGRRRSRRRPRRRAPARMARGARSSTSCRSSASSGCSTTTRPRSGRSTSGSCTRATPPDDRRDPGDRQAQRRVRRDRGGRRGRATGSRRGAGSRSTASRTRRRYDDRRRSSVSHRLDRRRIAAAASLLGSSGCSLAVAARVRRGDARRGRRAARRPARSTASMATRSTPASIGAADDGAAAVVIRLDTPGGSLDVDPGHRRPRSSTRRCR